MSESIPIPIAAAGETRPPISRSKGARRLGLALAGSLLFLLALWAWHRHGAAALAAPAPLPVVAVAKVDREDLRQVLTMAAEFRPYQEVSLHAKVSGYVQSIPVDVGDRVREGDVIAQLDVPELKNDLERDTAAVRASEEEVKRAEAAYEDAHLASERLLGVAKENPKLVAQQDVDTASTKERGAAGALAAAKQEVDEAAAQLHKAQDLVGYSTITAPFAGTITRRYADPGALIQAGTSSTQAMPLVDLMEDTRLRLVFPVPESAVPQVKLGAPVKVAVRSLDETFTGAVTRFSGKVDRATRTMATEVDMENQGGRYKPGMYAEVTLVLEQRNQVVSVPVEALSPGAQPAVLAVDRNGVVQSRTIQIGLQTPGRVEAVAGVQPGDLVIVGSRAGLEPGQKVAPKLMAPAAAE